MKKLIFGALAITISWPFFSFQLCNFLSLLAGFVPILLILGGGLAVYLGIEDLRAEKYKEEIDSDYAGNSQEPVTSSLQETSSETEGEQKIDPVKDSQEQQPSNEGPQNQVETESLPPKQEDQQDQQDPRAEFKGNTDTLVFHRTDCKFSQSKKCTMSFINRNDALNAGYKPCKVCNP
ncbi:MAG: hypothetical protein MI892_28985 [Desulfobacterales bacterium]|nr:hypothetical protein [Desulfobacterales bacterium]